MRLVWEGTVDLDGAAAMGHVVVDGTGIGTWLVMGARPSSELIEPSDDDSEEIMAACLRSSLARATYCRDMACATQQGLARGGDPAALLQALIRDCIDGPKEDA